VTAVEERAELKRIATEAIAEVNALKAQVSACIIRLDKVINHLLSDADSLALEAADERTEGVTVRKIKTTPVSGRIDTTKPNITPSPGAAVITLAPGKRACSNCRKPGHRKQNCPELGVADAVKKGLMPKGRKK
jgi:hypothetical protein